MRPLLALPLVLAACATGPTLTERLSAYVGVTEVELVSALGVPARTHEAGGLRFLQYERRRTVVQPPDPFWGGPFGPWWGGFPGYAYTVGCDITFTLRDGRVESFALRGDACR
jgi:hypothetical protein